METPAEYNYAALAFLNGSAAVEDNAFFTYENTLTEPSPALSLLSTPGLECLDTPDTVASHDFNTDNSSEFNHIGPFNTFGHDYALFDDNYEPRCNNTFGDDGLFHAPIHDAASSPHFEPLDKDLDEHRPTDKFASQDLFVPASALILESTSVSGTSSPVIPILDREITIPSLTRASSSGSTTFAVPKLPRGRKRKTSVAEDADFVPTSKAVSKSKKATSKDIEEMDERAALRAKNTEAAARSRARKRAAMESAESRIQELEEANAALRQLIAQKDKLLEIYQA